MFKISKMIKATIISLIVALLFVSGICYGVQKCVGEEIDTALFLLNTITITDLVPSKVYTYKFEITNLSRVGNWVTFGFENDTTVDKTKLKDFKARYGVIDSTGAITFGDWTSFTDGVTYSAFNITPSSLKVSGYTPAYGGGNLEVGRLDVWLEIKQVSESTLTLYKFLLQVVLNNDLKLCILNFPNTPLRSNSPPII